MKSKFLSVLVMTACIAPLAATESWHFRLGNYIYDKFYKKPDSEDLPLSPVLREEFFPLKDKDGNLYGVADGYEFDLTAAQNKIFPNLWLRCSKLDHLDRHLSWWPLSSKDTALLQFGRKIVNHEKEWKKWHVDTLMTDDGKGLRAKYYEDTFDSVDKNEKPIEIKLRRDQNSPYYQWAKITTENNGDKLYALNAYENTAYHDELKFLEFQLAKIEMYWDMKSSSEKELQCEEYRKQRELLKQEINTFKDDSNRKAFTRSCMKKNDFELVQKSREAYKQSLPKRSEE